MNKKNLNKSINLVNVFNNILIKKNLLESKQNILVTISGGQDSMCLLFIMLQLQKQWNWQFNILYCDHLWQKESFYVMHNIFKIVFLLKLPIYLPISLKKLLSENKARNWRYSSYERISIFYNYKIIITGHTASDRIETLLFNFFRGSGTEGIHSIDWKKPIFFNKTKIFFLNLKNKKLNSINVSKIPNFFFFRSNDKLKNLNIKINKYFRNSKIFNKNLLCNIFENSIYKRKFANSILNFNFKNFKFLKLKIKFFKILKKKNTSHILNFLKIKIYFPSILSKQLFVVRPLLYLNRYDLKKISKFWQIPLYPDKTNQSLNYSRNRIRKQILPTIRFFFNPKVDNLFFQFSEIAITEQFFLDSLGNRILKKIYFKTKKRIVLNISILNYLPIAIQRRIIKKSLKKFLNKNIKFYHVEIIIQLILDIYNYNCLKRNYRFKKYKKYIFFPKIGIIEFSSFFFKLYLFL